MLIDWSTVRTQDHGKDEDASQGSTRRSAGGFEYVQKEPVRAPRHTQGGRYACPLSAEELNFAQKAITEHVGFTALLEAVVKNPFYNIGFSVKANAVGVECTVDANLDGTLCQILNDPTRNTFSVPSSRTSVSQLKKKFAGDAKDCQDQSLVFVWMRLAALDVENCGQSLLVACMPLIPSKVESLGLKDLGLPEAFGVENSGGGERLPGSVNSSGGLSVTLSSVAKKTALSATKTLLTRTKSLEATADVSKKGRGGLYVITEIAPNVSRLIWVGVGGGGVREVVEAMRRDRRTVEQEIRAAFARKVIPTMPTTLTPSQSKLLESCKNSHLIAMSMSGLGGGGEGGGLLERSVRALSPRSSNEKAKVAPDSDDTARDETTRKNKTAVKKGLDEGADFVELKTRNDSTKTSVEAKAVVDCPASQFAAYIWLLHDSKDYLKPVKGRARSVVERDEARPNEQAVVETIEFGFWRGKRKRQCSRMVLSKNRHGGFVIGCENVPPLESETEEWRARGDNGSNDLVVNQGGCFLFIVNPSKDSPQTSCEVTVFREVNTFISRFALGRTILRLISPVVRGRHVFDRGSELDEGRVTEMTQRISADCLMGVAVREGEEENAIVSGLTSRFLGLGFSAVAEVGDRILSDRRVSVEACTESPYPPPYSSNVYRLTFEVDATLAECAAYVHLVDLRRRSADFFAAGGIEQEVEVLDKNWVYGRKCFGVKGGGRIGGEKRLTFETKMGWRAFSKGKISAYCDHASQVPSSKGGARWSFVGGADSGVLGVRMLNTFTKSWSPEGMKKTLCTCIVDLGAAGRLPAVVMSKVLLSFMPATSMIDFFSNEREREELIAKDFRVSVGLTLQGNEAASDEVEAWCRKLDEFVVKIGGKKQEVERRRSMTLVRTYCNSKNLGKIQKQKSKSSRKQSVKEAKLMNSATMRRSMTKSKKSSSFKDDLISPLTQFVLSAAEVGAPLLDVMSYVWSRGKKDSGLGDIPATETESGHRKMTTNHQMTWAKKGEGVFVLLYLPGEGKPEDGDAWLVRLTEVVGGGGVEKTKLERFVILRTDKTGQENGTVVHNFRDHFTKTKRLEDMDEKDGVVVGGRLGGGEEALGDVLGDYAGLRELAEKEPWFVEMMEAVLANSLKVGKDVGGALKELTAYDGLLIGRSFSSSLATTVTGEAAVDEWVCRFRALREFEEEAKWFRGMMNVIAKKLLQRVCWGLKLRVLIGSVLSVSDVASDVFIVWKYLSEGYGGGGGMIAKEDMIFFANCTLGMIALSALAQLTVVLANNAKRPRGLFLESFWVIIGAKPIVDAHRVASGLEKQEHNVFSPFTECMMIRIGEASVESVPSAILQAYVFLRSGGVLSAPLVTCCISILTTAFTMTSVCYDSDTSPHKRRENPAFYGYIPDNTKDRTITFFALFMAKAMHISSRTLSFALLLLVDWRYLGFYIAGDTALYLAYKLVRRDFTYWIPVGGAVGIFFSLIKRTLDKIITDFTLIVHLRHPYEVGGLYWAFCAVTSPIACYVCTWLYFESDVGKFGQFDEGTAWGLLGMFSFVWMGSFLMFFRFINPSYRKTFYSPQTAKDYLCQLYLKAKDDEHRWVVFKKHESYRVGVEREVHEWVDKNFMTWVNDAPHWFNHKLVPENIRPQ